jgi:hypothetical protein
MPKSKPLEANQSLLDLLPQPSEPTELEVRDDPVVNIPLTDVVQTITEVHVQPLSNEVQDLIAHRAKLVKDAAEKMEIWSRSSEKQVGEDDHAHQERIKREFEAAVLAARRQDDAPPPPKQPVPEAIRRQTEREMAAGAKMSAYWAEQQKFRPLPTAKEIQAEGVNTPVFRPGEYMHEKGGLDKNLVVQKG